MPEEDRPENRSVKRPSDEELRKRFAKWRNAMQANHDILMASLRSKVGPNGDVKQAYRDWYAQYRKEKNEAWARAAQRWQKREEANKNASRSS